MTEFERSISNWFHNGMHERAEAAYFRINRNGDGQDAYLYSEKLALIAYTLGLKEVFNSTLLPGGIREGRNFINFLIGCREYHLDSIQRLAYNFHKLIRQGNFTKVDKENIYDFAGLLLRYYQYDLVNQDNENQFIYQAQKLAAAIVNKTYPGDFDNSHKADVINRVLGFVPFPEGPTQRCREIPMYFKTAALITEYCPAPDTAITLCDNLRAYMKTKNIRIDETFIYGLKNNIIPAVLHNPDHLLASRGNLWGRYDFEYGIGDYMFKALTTRVTPGNINELMLIAGEIPASEYEPFMLNRRDAITLGQGHFDGRLRYLVHDQHPATAELIAAMVGYFDAGEQSEISERGHSAAAKLKAVADDIGEDISFENLADRNNYLEWLPRHGAPEIREQAIDILRRMHHNTEKCNLPKPQGLPPDLQKAVDSLDRQPNHIDVASLDYLLTNINDRLLKDIRQKTIGISPQRLQLLAWCTQVSIHALNRLDYEYQCGAYKENWFRQTVLLNELINQNCSSFNRKKFDSWYQEQIASESPLTAYHNLAARQNILLEGLCHKYKRLGLEAIRRQQLGRTDQDTARYLRQRINRQTQRRLETIAGGLLKQLQNLTVFRSASTRAGEYDRKQRLSEGWFELSQLLERKNIGKD